MRYDTQINAHTSTIRSGQQITGHKAFIHAIIPRPPRPAAGTNWPGFPVRPQGCGNNPLHLAILGESTTMPLRIGGGGNARTGRNYPAVET